jgi:chemotaxis response regulator CheB
MKAERVAKNFPVVCVGGSAGGLDAYTRLLRHLPADMGVGIVIVNHLRTVSTLLVVQVVIVLMAPSASVLAL